MLHIHFIKHGDSSLYHFCSSNTVNKHPSPLSGSQFRVSILEVLHLCTAVVFENMGIFWANAWHPNWATLLSFVCLSGLTMSCGLTTQIRFAPSPADHSAGCCLCVINWLDKFIEWPTVYGGYRRNIQRASERGEESETETYLELRMSRQRCLSTMVTVSIVQCLCIHGVNNRAKQKDPNTSKALWLHSSLLPVRPRLE